MTKEEPTDIVSQTTDDVVLSNPNKRLIVILEQANLETVKNGRSYELLNADRHQHIIRKHKLNLSDCRPDITHQCLLMLMDSPLNRSGHLQVFVHTKKGVLIEINPQTRIPRTFDRFCGLIVQLLDELCIRANETSQKLLKIIKNPVTDYLPSGCKKYVMSCHAEKQIHARELVPKDPNEIIAVIIGAIAKGSIGVDYGEGEYSICSYPLSAALACTKICTAFEDEWNIK
ncbi:hypothetical protein SNEBB_004829 [Seison nebaliae]|nr:hypothetical protein SNEBB_004829 [Seison nebaliae]